MYLRGGLRGGKTLLVFLGCPHQELSPQACCCSQFALKGCYCRKRPEHRLVIHAYKGGKCSQAPESLFVAFATKPWFLKGICGFAWQIPEQFGVELSIFPSGTAALTKIPGRATCRELLAPVRVFPFASASAEVPLIWG